MNNDRAREIDAAVGKVINDFYGGLPPIKASDMSLRDYLAAKAMQGLAANPDSKASISDAAECAYAMADAMLKERNK